MYQQLGSIASTAAKSTPHLACKYGFLSGRGSFLDAELLGH
jgi:hypothetical protein